MIRPPLASNQASFFHAGRQNQTLLAQAQNARQQWQTSLAKRASVQAAQSAQAAEAQRRVDANSQHQARPGIAANQNVLAIENVAHAEKRTGERQPFRSQPVAALQGQNRGMLHTGSVQTVSPSAPLARTAQRLPPVPRPIAFKRCSSCS
jgi:hypothetical protein